MENKKSNFLRSNIFEENKNSEDYKESSKTPKKVIAPILGSLQLGFTMDFVKQVRENFKKTTIGGSFYNRENPEKNKNSGNKKKCLKIMAFRFMKQSKENVEKEKFDISITNSDDHENYNNKSIPGCSKNGKNKEYFISDKSKINSNHKNKKGFKNNKNFKPSTSGNDNENAQIIEKELLITEQNNSSVILQEPQQGKNQIGIISNFGDVNQGLQYQKLLSQNYIHLHQYGNNYMNGYSNYNKNLKNTSYNNSIQKNNKQNYQNVNHNYDHGFYGNNNANGNYITGQQNPSLYANQQNIGSNTNYNNNLNKNFAQSYPTYGYDNYNNNSAPIQKGSYYNNGNYASDNNNSYGKGNNKNNHRNKKF